MTAKTDPSSARGWSMFCKMNAFMFNKSHPPKMVDYFMLHGKVTRIFGFCFKALARVDKSMSYNRINI